MPIQAEKLVLTSLQSQSLPRYRCPGNKSKIILILTAYPAGYGRVGKHRKHPGGKGMAGGQHHHRTNLDRFHPGYFGKVGMRYFRIQGNHFWKPVLNLDKLWTLVPEEKRDQYLQSASKSNAPVIDTLAAGYGKVLGKGRIPQVPVIVKARFVSKLAEEKIKAAGGVVELIA
ncbi:probable 60S ribosomal protein L28 [Zygosaccharomyces bailii ISA1307]|nr:probable 60S ribosomal protein L28 [Zygosaccharomyces bailii ISA1307]